MKKNFKTTFVLLICVLSFCVFASCKKEMKVNSIELDKEEIVLKVGNTTTLNPTVDVENSDEYQIAWNSSDNAIATIDANGEIRAIASGMATITATLGDKTDTVKVFVADLVVEDTSTIQNTIEGAETGNVIYVSSGTYNEAVVIENKNVTIIGADSVKIMGPENYEDIPSTSAIAEESTNYSALLTIINSDVEIKNITVEGIPQKTDSATNITHTNRYAGIAVLNSNAIFDNISVTNIQYTASLRGMQNGIGIYCVAYDSNKTFTITNSTISYANKCSLIVRSGVSKATITNCTFIGNGEQEIITENGLQIACPAEIKDNTIKNFKYNSQNEWSHGSYAMLIQSTQANSVQISGNTIDNVDNGIYAYTAGSVSGGKSMVESNNTFLNLHEWQVEDSTAINKYEEAV